MSKECDCECGSSCACGDSNQGCSCGDCGCGDCGCGEEQHFVRRYQTKAERKADLEAYYAELETYQSELQLEMQAVKEMIADLQK